ncbi:hypothetical protein QQF54_20525 [Lelliottia sp. V106_10]|uniref:hypothetical protein n=1 Tax=Lelliottia wanjuensis TaxID=3050585 RepID=UPI00254BC704|nr:MULTISPECIES: hypothetical protein [unclassified Lelliottia]MDK9356416.1 hypothetical protein [Lelliottia sp. V106_16]MDK9375729.1 hypothetical protein [Lelliottia sp. V106_10]MDK9602279.1 hypothetical protein [Lelliottia sp. V106_5]
MTTILSQDTVFSAVDRLWTDENDLPAAAPFRKFYVLNDSILFFSGYIDPILAILAGYLQEQLGLDDEFVDAIINYAEMDGHTCELIEVDKKTGEIMYTEGVESREAYGCKFYCAGSGSDYAYQSYVDGLGIFHKDQTAFNFPVHGINLITCSMRVAFNRDQCSGGWFNYAVWSEGALVTDRLDWIDVTEIDNYNQNINLKIIERFESKESLQETIAMMIDEEHKEGKEMEIESKLFDQPDNQRYSPQTNLAAKGRSEMSNTTQQQPRVAVKTSGSARGTVLSASSLKARLAQRKAEGLS